MSGQESKTPTTPKNRSTSWLRSYIANASGFWKAAMCFQITFLVLMLLHAGALLAGWYNVSHRMLGYSSLAFVGFFASLLCHAYVSIRGSMKQNAEKKQNEKTR
ncbi:hypothetical protein [Agrobacterium fabrum]|uniref:hypothetical protein n=1 Tax=Agrobacterium fabrum TaxID=1176649 RepID=UPI002158955D|nr:hypothetical protein [Agrobacterium fabrum]MCR6725995.1 hypothetical protein [Agrobacterium fabrum]